MIGLEAAPPSAADGGFDDFALKFEHFEAVLEIARGMEQPRAFFEIPDDATPQPITDLATRIQQTHPVVPVFTRAILDRHSLESRGPDPAYAPHFNPASFAGNTALLSLDSMAYFYAHIKGRTHALLCYPGTLIIASSSLWHWQSPPRQGEVRHTILFANEPPGPFNSQTGNNKL